MVSETNKRPPRIPLSPEEVAEFIRFKKHKERVKIERFKKTKTYKALNAFNIICIVIYTEVVFAFLGSCSFTTHYIQSSNTYFGEEIKAGKRIFSSAVFTTVNNKEYDIGIHDTCTIPKNFSGLLVGKDWILRKEIKVRFERGGKDFFIKRSFPLLFISILWGFVTFVLFGYNMNQNVYSLHVISFINLISILSFMLL